MGHLTSLSLISHICQMAIAPTSSSYLVVRTKQLPFVRRIKSKMVPVAQRFGPKYNPGPLLYDSPSCRLFAVLLALQAQPTAGPLGLLGLLIEVCDCDCNVECCMHIKEGVLVICVRVCTHV